MKRGKLIGVVLLCALCFTSVTVFASSGHGEKHSKKIGLLLVAFGSSEDSAQVSFRTSTKR